MIRPTAETVKSVLHLGKSLVCESFYYMHEILFSVQKKQEFFFAVLRASSSRPVSVVICG